jgi:branched-chain amino acid transport system ATP-binding protein
MLLRTRGLTAFYGDAQALFGIDFHLSRGEVVAVIGANGAGKSTFLKSLVGVVKVPREAIVFDGAPIGGLPPGEIVRRGIALVPEGRRLFPSLSVEENLLMGANAGRPGPWNLRRVYAMFPILESKRHLPGTSLSGGQQQMVAIGRALMSNPALLLCDELSLGLAPIVVDAIYVELERLRGEGSALLVVEQQLAHAIALCDRVVLLEHGAVAWQGPAADAEAHVTAAVFDRGAGAD